MLTHVEDRCAVEDHLRWWKCAPSGACFLFGKIRLWGIDAPEKTQDFGQKSKENLSNLVFSKEVKVDIKRKDRYGRHVGKIYLQNVYVNLEMVKAGFAWYFKQYAKKDTD
jgi:micrococcal nuclease